MCAVLVTHFITEGFSMLHFIVTMKCFNYKGEWYECIGMWYVVKHFNRRLGFSKNERLKQY